MTCLPLPDAPCARQRYPDRASKQAHAVQSAVQAVELVSRVAGPSGVYTRSPLECSFRDVQQVVPR
jgi:hypothetical protein